MANVSSRRTWMLLPVFAAAAACSRGNSSAKPVQRYQLRGEIVRLQPSSRIAVIKHDKIDGWMEAMTMEFPVKEEAEFAKLAVGRKVQATVLVQDLDYWLTDIRME